MPEIKRDLAEKQPNLYQSLDDLGIPTAKPEPIEREHHEPQDRAEQISTGLDRPVTPERHTNERGRELPPVGSSESNELGKGIQARVEQKIRQSQAPHLEIK